MSFYTHAIFTGQLYWYVLTILFAFPWQQSSSTCGVKSKKGWMVTNLINSQNMNTLACFLKDSFSKLLWRLCGMFGALRHCTQVERLSSEKNVQAYQQSINIFAWKHQKNLSFLLSNGFPLELDKFYQKSQVSFRLKGFSLELMIKYWPAFWPFFVNITDLNLASLRLTSNTPNQALACSLVFNMINTISSSVKQACCQGAVKGDALSH